MQYKKCVALLLVLSFLFSCNNGNKKYLNHKVDTLINDYLKQHSNLTFDTNDQYYQMLRALYNNDTAFLRSQKEEIEWQKEAGKMRYPYDSCLREYRKIDSLGYDEVYKFRYRKAKDRLLFTALLGAKDKQYSLHYFVYREANRVYNNHTSYSYGVNPQTCKIFKEATIKLSEKEYYFLQNKILFADFWNLKPRVKDEGWLHADNLYIEAYKRPYKNENNGQYHFVTRQAVERLALKLPLDEVLKKIGTNFEDLNLFLYPEQYGDTNYYHYY